MASFVDVPDNTQCTVVEHRKKQRTNNVASTQRIASASKKEKPMLIGIASIDEHSAEIIH